MKEFQEYFLEDNGTTYQLRTQAREAGIFFSLTVSNALGTLQATGNAEERDGDLESCEDEDGHAHLVTLYRYRRPDAQLSIAIDLDTRDLAWIVKSSSPEEREGLKFAHAFPLVRVYG